MEQSHEQAKDNGGAETPASESKRPNHTKHSSEKKLGGKHKWEMRSHFAFGPPERLRRIVIGHQPDRMDDKIGCENDDESDKDGN